MKLKSPLEPIILSAKSYDWLENMLKKNAKRTKLTKKEKELAQGIEEFDPSTLALIYESKKGKNNISSI